MNWKKVSIVTTNDGVEAVSNLLIENDAKGTEIINSKDLQNLQTEFPSELLILDDLVNVKIPVKITFNKVNRVIQNR